jgi:hypothetical protein
MTKPLSFQEKIEEKSVKAEELAEELAADASLVRVVFAGLESPRAAVKYKCLKVFNLLSRQSPEKLYPHFEQFAALLDDSNNIFKWNAQDILAHLAGADAEAKFLPLLRKYYGMMREGNLITAAHAVENSALIVRALPAEEKRITRWLAEVGNLALPTPECHNILAGKVINTFDLYFAQSGSRDTMLAFARLHLDNTRPATRKKAETFLKKRAPRYALKAGPARLFA